MKQCILKQLHHINYMPIEQMVNYLVDYNGKCQGKCFPNESWSPVL